MPERIYPEKTINTARLKGVKVVGFTPPPSCQKPDECFLYEDTPLAKVIDNLYGNFEGWMEIDPVYGSVYCGFCCPNWNPGCTLKTRLEVQKKTLTFPR